jgi:general secretion pathway protein C
MVNERKQKLLRTGAILFTLLISALLCARGATQILASSLLPVQEKPAKPMRRNLRAISEEREPSPQELAQAVLSRNIFDSTVGSMDWDLPVDLSAQSEETPTELVRDPDGEPAVCQGALRLVASFVVPRVPALSFASIEAGGKTMLYRSGMQVDGHDVVGIREHRVFMRPSGRPLCQITMFKPPDAPAQPMTMGETPMEEPTPSPSPVQGGLTEDELSQGITQVSDTQYNVARSLLDKVLSNQSELMRAARIIPYEENGRVIGVKVYGIRRSSLLGRLGVQNGDVLRTINGFDLSSPDSALEAYTKLREMDQFTIAMVRRGQPRNMDYSVK